MFVQIVSRKILDKRIERLTVDYHLTLLEYLSIAN